MILTIHSDGGARGNPGPSGFGVVILDNSGHSIYQKGVYLGQKTNNEAEYGGLLHGLSWIRDNQTKYDIEKITFYLDSELVVNQLNGRYRVKATNLKPLYQQALSLISGIVVPLSFSHVCREHNALADQLANNAMDSRL